MLFLLQSFVAWIAAALALGLVCGLPAAWAGQGLRWSARGALLAVVYCSGVAAAALQLAPGRAGFWLETGLLIFGAYALGVLWGGLCAVVLSRLFGGRAGGPAPDWGATARDFTRQADAYAAVARQGASAFDAAAGLLAPAKAAAPPVAEKPTPEALDDLALVHGLDRVHAEVLRGSGVANCAALASLTGDRLTELAARLGLDKAIPAYWAAQALLLAHGVATDYARAHAGASEETPSEPPLDAASALMLSAVLPQVASPRANDAFYPGERPLGLLAPPRGETDDLRRIAGVDEAVAQELNRLGVWTFRQIAAWSPGAVRWVESYFAAPGRVAREQWREQALVLLTRVKPAA
jgi:predicted flap endonuclease-1-like 5' DNA nuclease